VSGKTVRFYYRYDAIQRGILQVLLRGDRFYLSRRIGGTVVS